MSPTASRWALIAWVAVGFAPTSVAAQARSILSYLPTEGRSIGIGSQVGGSLTTDDPLSLQGQHLDAWQLYGLAGTTVTIDARSEAFDAQLFVAGPGLTGPLFDDDSGGACDARITITFPDSGAFTVVVGSYDAGAVGGYVVSVSPLPSATALGTCAGDATASAPPVPATEQCRVVQRMMWLSVAVTPEGGPDYGALAARERVACEMGVEAAAAETWDSGLPFRAGTNWHYPNGRLALSSSFGVETWYYPNGVLALSEGLVDTWYYPNGVPARSGAGFGESWRLPTGEASSPSGIVAWAIARLPAEVGQDLSQRYRDETSEDLRTLYLVVMAAQAAR